MERSEVLERWNDMWKEGNWIPSWPDSLKGMSAEEANWSPGPGAHSVWQEVVHVTFWRQSTLARLDGGESPSDEEIARLEFAAPETPSEEAWAETLEALERSQNALAQAIEDPSKETVLMEYHLIHDAYHLGRITHLRAMRGTAPAF